MTVNAHGRRGTKRGNKRDRQWLYHWVRAYCDEAKVPAVCVHSLRGLHATLATEAGATSHEPPRDLRRLFVVSQAAIAWLCC
jgi:hypothetical protein